MIYIDSIYDNNIYQSILGRLDDMIKRQLNTRIPEELYDRVELLSQENNMSKPEIVTEALSLYIDNTPIADDIKNDTEGNKIELWVDRVQFLESQIEKKDNRIQELEGINNKYIGKISQVFDQKLIESSYQKMGRMDALKMFFLGKS